ncbi:MAG: hypothetical protein GY847_35920 [Proteobacteria bacterium]|nr:hypothetical protein [Pseudomonadota bacterium]
MGLEDELKNLDFDWQNVRIHLSPQSLDIPQFDISPQDFSEFAREDFADADARGVVNALTNAKRAIDCQVDMLLTCFGYDPFKKLPKQVNDYLDGYQSVHGKINAPQKLKLIQTIGAAPSGLISGARRLRNRLEHNYELPTKDEAQESIELASLFIGSVNYFLSQFDNAPWLYCNDEYDPAILISYHQKEHEFSVSADDDYGKSCFDEIRVGLEDSLYLPLLRLQGTLGKEESARDALQYLLTVVNCPTPKITVVVQVEREGTLIRTRAPLGVRNSRSC